jgi:hypothetical protein
LSGNVTPVETLSPCFTTKSLLVLVLSTATEVHLSLRGHITLQ